MKLKKSPFSVVLLVITIFVSIAVSFELSTVHADSPKKTTLTIVKYGLKSESSEFSSSQTINTGEPINNLPTDNHGNELEPLEGIHYKIQEVLPKDGNPRSIDKVHLNSATYTKVGSALDIVTDSDGIATLPVNSNGNFIISEIANTAAHLSHPAVPFLVELPVASIDGSGNLSTVYIYPKSSIDSGETTGKTPAKDPADPPAKKTLTNQSNQAIMRSLANTKSVSSDGTKMLVSAPHNFLNANKVGEVFYFEKVNGFWEQKQKFTSPDGVNGDGFGYGVAMNNHVCQAPQYCHVGLLSPALLHGAVYRDIARQNIHHGQRQLLLHVLPTHKALSLLRVSTQLLSHAHHHQMRL